MPLRSRRNCFSEKRISLSIRFRIPDRPDAVGFALSPVGEALVSLHVLLFPKIHALQHPWVRAMRRVSPALKREIRAFAFLYEDATPDCVLPPSLGAQPGFEEHLAQIAQLPAETIAYDLGRPLFFWKEADAGGPERLSEPAVREAAVERAARYGTAAGGAAELIFDDPLELRRRFVELLGRYWEEAFALEWDRLEPRFAAELDEARARIGSDGLHAFLGSQPEVTLDAGVLVRRSPHEHEVEITPERRLMLVPSAYIWPHSRANCDPPWPLALIYPARFARVELERAPDTLVQGLRALGDATRLRALRLIAERARSTEELAPLVGLSESGLSKHLRALVDAGLLTQRRQGYYVLYGLNREALTELPRGLLDFVDDGRRD